MDLEKFISLSLSQIAKGIEQANRDLEGTNAIINPMTVDINSQDTYGTYRHLDGIYLNVQKIDFDVAVTVSDNEEIKGGGGVSIGAITIGGIQKNDLQNSSLSRIKFSIPMVLPYIKENRPPRPSEANFINI